MLKSQNEKEELKKEDLREKRKIRDQNKKEKQKLLLKENENLRKENQQLKEENQNLREENNRLIEEIQALEENADKDTFYEVIAKNSKALVNQLPEHSPFRRPILGLLVPNTEKQRIMKFYGIKTTTWKRIQHESGIQLLVHKYTVGATREKISQDQTDEIKRILEDILPVQSGRNYRVQEETDENIYQAYCQTVKKGIPVGKTYFIYVQF